MVSRPSFGTLTLWTLLAVFFVSSLVLTVGVPDMYNSPDERAAALSVGSFVREHTFVLSEPWNERFAGILSPRSMVAVGSILAPITFPGLPFFYGLIGKLVTFDGVKLLTPLLAVLAVLAWRSILERFLSHRAALVGAVLALFLAGFWFYTARVFMHNVPFLSLAIFGVYFLAVKRRPALSGLCFGLALLFRTSEIVWMVPTGLIFLAFFFPRPFPWKSAAVFLVSVLVGFAPFFFWNNALFGSPWMTGYAVTVPDLAPLAGRIGPAYDDVASTIGSAPSVVSRVLLPFGFHPRLAWHNFVSYQLELTWWMTILAVLGLPFLVAPRLRDSRVTRILRAILVATFLAGGYLTFFYGSWKITDNPDPTVTTLANSYVRYWLPIYLASTIPAALFIEWLSGKARTLFAGRLVLALVLLPVAVLSVRLVFLHPDDGLLRTREVLFESVTIRERVLELTPSESIIVVDRADKILFPARRVVTPLRSERTYASLPALAAEFPLFYFGLTLPPEDFVYLNNVILLPLGLSAEPMETIGEETLYRFAIL